MYRQPPPNYVSAAQPAPPPLEAGGGGGSETRKFRSSTPPEGASLLPVGPERAALGGGAFARLGGPAPSLRSSGSYPDDFGFGVDVKSSSVSVQMAFVRKVYSVVCLQLFTSALMGALMLSSTSFQAWAWNNSWALILSMIMTFVSLGLVFWKRHSVPANYALLAMFTFFESYMIGNTVAFFDSRLVLQAVIITTGTVVALTLFTFQTKWDFSGMGPWLTGALFVLILVSLVQIFFPFSRTLDLFIAICTALVFIGFILYDTQNLFRMSPDEYIAASITLYVDVLNLFLAILRILQHLNDDS